MTRAISWAAASSPLGTHCYGLGDRGAGVAGRAAGGGCDYHSTVAARGNARRVTGRGQKEGEMIAKRLVLVVLCLGIALVASPPADPTTHRVLAAGFCDGVSQIPQGECQALVALYNSTNGSGWTNHSGWLATDTPCSWYGVTCDAGHVTWLSLSINQLTGSIPPELGNLARLDHLYLNNNQLTGSIPPELSNLANLQVLGLFSNHLSGGIPPELGNLANLRDLWLGNNQLSGGIPPELGNLANLQYLWLDNNHLSGGIPPELSNLAKLQVLDLYSNQLSGGIPPELGNLANLKNLYLSANQLSGALPHSLIALHLDTFWFNNTDLCEPGDAAFQIWLSTIPDLHRTSVICQWTWLPLVLKAG